MAHPERMQLVTKLNYASQYTGTGSTSDVLACLNTCQGQTFTLVSDTGTVLTVKVSIGDPTFDYNITLNSSDWAVATPVQWGVVTNAQYAAQYNTWPSVISANASSVIASKAKYGGYGQSILGALTVGSTNIAVTIKPAQPDTGYVANAFIDGPALSLGTITVGTPVKTSASVVTVPITNTGLVTVTLTSSVVSVNVTNPQS